MKSCIIQVKQEGEKDKFSFSLTTKTRLEIMLNCQSELHQKIHGSDFRVTSPVTTLEIKALH